MSNLVKGIFWSWVTYIAVALVLTLLGLYLFSTSQFEQIVKSIEFFSDYPGLSGLFILILSPMMFLLALSAITTIIGIMKRPN